MSARTADSADGLKNVACLCRNELAVDTITEYRLWGSISPSIREAIAEHLGLRLGVQEHMRFEVS